MKIKLSLKMSVLKFLVDSKNKKGVKMFLKEEVKKNYIKNNKISIKRKLVVIYKVLFILKNNILFKFEFGYYRHLLFEMKKKYKGADKNFLKILYIDCRFEQLTHCYNKAKKILEFAAQFVKNDIDAGIMANEYGHIFMGLYKYKKAKFFYKKALRLFNNNPELYNSTLTSLAILESSFRNFKGAERYYDKALEGVHNGLPIDLSRYILNEYIMFLSNYRKKSLYNKFLLLIKRVDKGIVNDEISLLIIKILIKNGKNLTGIQIYNNIEVFFKYLDIDVDKIMNELNTEKENLNVLYGMLQVYKILKSNKK